LVISLGLGRFHCFAYLRKVSSVSFIAGIRFVFFEGYDPIGGRTYRFQVIFQLKITGQLKSIIQWQEYQSLFEKLSIRGCR
jgi:hypothetical protein